MNTEATTVSYEPHEGPDGQEVPLIKVDSPLDEEHLRKLKKKVARTLRYLARMPVQVPPETVLDTVHNEPPAWEPNADPVSPDSDEGGRLRNILLFPDSRLTEPSRAVTARTSETLIETLCRDLIKTAKQTKAAGLSAPQVGERLRVIVIQVNGNDPGEYKAIINPVIYAEEDDAAFVKEGCLSFPGVHEMVKRYPTVWVEGVDIAGKPIIDLKLSGTAAQAAQHEVEHLDGRLFIEHLSMHRRDAVRTYMKKVNRKLDSIWKHSRGKVSTMEAVFQFKPED